MKISFGWLSIAIVAGYFAVGFWPFEFRSHNHVRWLTTPSGLSFKPYGIAFDRAPLPPPSSNGTAQSSANFTVELWLEAQHEPANNVFDILTIHNPRLPLDFNFCQWKRDFLLRATTHPRQPPGKIPEVDLNGALPEAQAQFITVRGDGTGTDFFLNGNPAEHFPHFELSAEALDGQLILGNSASGKHPWTGRLLGLALYNRALDSTQIARHYALWTRGHTDQLTSAASLRAFYLFKEGHGRLAEDFSGNRHHLVIPAIFQPVHRELLIPPWKDLSYHHPDYSDIAVNILGFVPFGFCFFLYCLRLRPKNRNTNFLFVVFAGAAVSLAIEVIQAWLPNRTSSLMDLLTNTAGTLLGLTLALTVQRKVDRFTAGDHADGADA